MNLKPTQPLHSEHQALSVFDALMDPKAAAEFLGLSTLTLADMRCKGTGPQFCKAGRLVRYRFRDLQAWLDARTFSNTSQVKGA